MCDAIRKRLIIVFFRDMAHDLTKLGCFNNNDCGLQVDTVSYADVKTMLAV